MLLELSVKHLAVIDHVRVTFQNGFHVLTGETGAGKSILIDALSFAIGGRASADLVRHGHDKAEIEALFDVPQDHPVWSVLEDNGIEASPDEPIIVRRDIAATGKSTARINGQLVTMATLKAAGETLVNIHGQHEHQSLLRTDKHLDWLDAYAARDIEPAKREYRALYDRYVDLKQELEQTREAGMTALQMADLYRFQWEEIAAAALTPGEEESLQEDKRKLSNAERLHTSANQAYEFLYGNGQALEGLGKALQRLTDIVKYDEKMLSPLLEQLQSAYYQIEDASYQLRDYREGIEFNPEKLDRIESRLQTIAALRRKYGETAEDVLNHAQRIKIELDRLDNHEERIAVLEKQLESILEDMRTLADRLSSKRREAASRLSRELTAHLKDLHMEKTQFEVALGSTGDRWTKDGTDTAEFLISPNPGEPLRSLHKIASGGELSRIMLALKSIFASVDRVPVLIFDEVDTGVSGRAAQAIAEKMAWLARSAQVFAITHLPQVACMADAQYGIMKSVREERTFTEIRRLSGDDRAKELARMLGGVEVTGTTLQHAQEMLALAEDRKTAWSRA
ncbi:DNA repair protein RecN [Paenibacillus alkalitolerans]|uniref:DNA repair protein RecN n=1 Tax=Paenibacillus alkalitolerans TaxID=2799335 RepID=UPI0018F4401B|nr:DNA repair protein RecN [Paenibacillus alkalitolerans]